MEYIDWQGVATHFGYGALWGFGLGCILGLFSLGVNSILSNFRDL